MKTRHRVILIAALFGALLGGFVAYDLWRDYESTVAIESAKTSNLARLLEEHALQSLGNIETSLNRTVEEIKLAGFPTKANAALLRERLRAHLPPGDFVRSLVLLDAKGKIVASTLEEDSPGLDRSAQSIFTLHRDASVAGMALGPAAKVSVSGEWRFPVSLRIASANGGFAGVLVALVDPGHFASLYSTLDIGKNGFVTLFLRDGWILARSPFDAKIVARNWSDAPMFRQHLPAATEGTVRQVVAATKVQSLYSYRALRQFPVVVSVGVSLSESLANWHQRAWRDGLILFLMLLGLGWAIANLLRQQAREESSAAALRESERHLSTLMQNLPGYVYRVAIGNDNRGYDDRLEFISDGVAPITGLSPEECLVDRSLTHGARVHPDDTLSLRQAVDAALAADRSYECEYRIVAQSGEVKWVWERGRGIKDPSGKLTRIEGFVTETTARHKAELEREQIEIRLRQTQKLEAIGTLAGGVAHDFNNVLAAILSNAELALAGLTPAQPERAYLAEIVGASQRAKLLVQQILTFSRKHPIERRTIALAEEIEKLQLLLRAALPAGVEMIVDAGNREVLVFADQTQLHQVIVNLCTNAWQALDESADARQGRIEIRCDELTVDEAFTRLHPDMRPGRHARIAVIDNGKGMDATTEERMFEPFFTTKEVGVGTGIGLSVVHGIVSAHGGAIRVKSKLGEGTRVEVTLPCAEHPQHPESPPALSPTPRGKGQTILCLDDSEVLVHSNTALLKSMGYRVQGFTRPAEALASFHAQPAMYDLVLTDLNMPGTSGINIAEEVARIRPDLPVVLVSGFVDERLRHKAASAGVRRILDKPFSADELGAALHDTLGDSDQAEPKLSRSQ
ncbi:MAG: ATP-binding protein [Burkholderiales bacterium]